MFFFLFGENWQWSNVLQNNFAQRRGANNSRLSPLIKKKKNQEGWVRLEVLVLVYDTQEDTTTRVFWLLDSKLIFPFSLLEVVHLSLSEETSDIKCSLLRQWTGEYLSQRLHCQKLFFVLFLFVFFKSAVKLVQHETRKQICLLKQLFGIAGGRFVFRFTPRAVPLPPTLKKASPWHDSHVFNATVAKLLQREEPKALSLLCGDAFFKILSLLGRDRRARAKFTGFGKLVEMAVALANTSGWLFNLDFLHHIVAVKREHCFWTQFE